MSDQISVTPNVTAIASRAQLDELVSAALEVAEAYYRTGDSPWDDATYDAVIARVTAALDANPSWESPQTAQLLQHVAGGTAAGDVAHSRPMLSLDNVFTDEDLDTFATRAAGGPLLVSPKLDGMAAAGLYVDGELVQVITRGDGIAGEDVTAQARHIAGLPSQLAASASFEVRGEIFLTDDDFTFDNELRVEHGDKAFVNARNGVAGVLRGRDRAYQMRASFAAYDVIGLGEDQTSHAGRLAALAPFGVASVLDLLTELDIEPALIEPADVVARVAQIGTVRAGLGYGIDGAVARLDDVDACAALGFTSKAPRWATAFKFPPAERLTTLEAIELQVGRTGVLTPVAKLTPVHVGGTTVTSVTCSNPLEVVRKDLRIGDKVWVRRAGDVIPEIVGVALDQRAPDATAWVPPANCPRCDSLLDTSSRRWRCVQPGCGVIEAMAHIASRKALDIDGLGRERIIAMHAAGLVTDVGDLFTLTAEQLEPLPRFGAKSAAALVANIQAARDKPLSRLLAGLNLLSVGSRLGRRIAAVLPTLEQVRAADVETLGAIDGIGEVRAEQILASLEANTVALDKLEALEVATTEPQVEDATGGDRPLDGLKVVVTGSLPSMSRTDAQAHVEALGGTVSSGVSKTTGLLVAGEKAGSKLTKAQSLGVPVLDGAAFEALRADSAKPAVLADAGN